MMFSHIGQDLVGENFTDHSSLSTMRCTTQVSTDSLSLWSIKIPLTPTYIPSYCFFSDQSFCLVFKLSITCFYFLYFTNTFRLLPWQAPALQISFFVFKRDRTCSCVSLSYIQSSVCHGRKYYEYQIRILTPFLLPNPFAVNTPPIPSPTLIPPTMFSTSTTVPCNSRPARNTEHCDDFNIREDNVDIPSTSSGCQGAHMTDNLPIPLYHMSRYILSFCRYPIRAHMPFSPAKLCFTIASLPINSFTIASVIQSTLYTDISTAFYILLANTLLLLIPGLCSASPRLLYCWSISE